MRASAAWFVLGAAAAIATTACATDDDLTAVRPGTVFVEARDNFFQPDTIVIAVGIPVRWTNRGQVFHTVTSDSALWTSDSLAPTWWFEVRFDSAGTFPYHCSLHDSVMIGTIVVQ